MTLMCRQSGEVNGINEFEIQKDPQQTAVRPPWTPPKSPEMEGGKIAVGKPVLSNEMPGSKGDR